MINFALFFTVLLFGLAHALHECQFIDPMTKTVWASNGHKEGIIFYIPDLSKMPANFTLSMYREIPGEDSLIMYQDYFLRDLKPYGSSPTHFILERDISQDHLVNARYQYSISVSRWYGRKYICDSNYFRIVRIGAQPNVPQKLQYIQAVAEPNYGGTYNCKNISVALDFKMPFNDNMRISVVSLADDSLPTTFIGDIKKEQMANMEGFRTFVSIPTTIEGPFVFDFFADRFRDVLIYRSGVFECTK